MSVQNCTLSTLVDLFKSGNTEANKPFCFILGAGASVESGIPAGETLARKWLDEFKRHESQKANDFIAQKKINDSNVGNFYSEIYEQRFYADYAMGFASLQSIMEGKNPSCGYFHLAKIITETDSNLVITTNFDNLVEDAIFSFTKKRPVTITHELLAKYANVFRKKPIIAKIHRDLQFFPKNTVKECSELAEEWKNLLNTILSFYTPIIIGYGGNDGSLMTFFDEFPDANEKNIYWCYREESGMPNERIMNTLEKYKGFLVPIKGFDETMFLFGAAFAHGSGEETMRLIFDEKIDNYIVQFDKLNKKYNEIIQGTSSTSTDTDVLTASTIESMYEQNIRSITEKISNGNAKADDFFKRSHYYQSIGKLDDARKDIYDAIKLNPNNAEYYYRLATIYKEIKEDIKALAKIGKAIALDGSKSSYHVERAQIYVNLGESELADIDMTTAKELGYRASSEGL